MRSTLSEGSTAAPRSERGRHAARSPIRDRIGAVSDRLITSLGRPRIDVAAAPAAAPAPSPAAPRTIPEGVVEVRVGEGETVADIAVRHGMSTASLLGLNGLGWRAQLTAGQALLVKPAAPRIAERPSAESLHRHRVQDGETVERVAERHGVSAAAVLLANGLSRGSVVRAGQQLVIPVPNLRRSGSDAVALTGEMRENAGAVIAAGRLCGVPDDGIVVALVAAMQDGSLHNLPFGEDDAVGLFQQRPSDGWGDPEDLRDPRFAALAFFGGPGSGVVAPAAGLLDVGGWEFMSIGEAAAAVQRTAAPAAYAKWERCAREWLLELERPRAVR